MGLRKRDKQYLQEHRARTEMWMYLELILYFTYSGGIILGRVLMASGVTQEMAITPALAGLPGE